MYCAVESTLQTYFIAFEVERPSLAETHLPKAKYIFNVQRAKLNIAAPMSDKYSSANNVKIRQSYEGARFGQHTEKAWESYRNSTDSEELAARS